MAYRDPPPERREHGQGGHPRPRSPQARHDNDGHLRVPDDALRHAPKEQAADRAATVAPEDDHVGPLGCCGFEDRFAGLALPDEELDLDTFAATSLHELLRGGPGPRARGSGRPAVESTPCR